MDDPSKPLEPSKPFEIFEVLARHQVEAIVVGGVAAVLWGAPVATFDLDILYRNTEENIGRLIAALREIGAAYRDPAGRRIEPDESRLSAGRHNLLVTRFGPLDVLGRIGNDLTYNDLLPRSREWEVEGMRIRVLDLEAVIETKEQAGREKDLDALRTLRATLWLRKSSGE